MTHSEGPYTIERDSKGRILITANDGYDGVCLINMRNKNAEGNAHLLAAAPALLAACEDALWGIEAEFGARVTDVNFPLLRCAISSAKGEGV
jgi:hypothetical protein